MAGPIALLAASLLGYLLAATALRPVEAMRARAGEISGARAGERLPLPEARDELRRLGETLNAMLERIDAALERERAFVADAGHELRTPVAILKAEIELALAGDRSPQELRAALASAREETERLARLADDLLVLARIDDGRPAHPPRAPGGGRASWRPSPPASPRAPPRRGARSRSPPTRARPSMADRLRIEQAVTNLVDNALRHGAGPVVVRARRAGGRRRAVGRGRRRRACRPRRPRRSSGASCAAAPRPTARAPGSAWRSSGRSRAPTGADARIEATRGTGHPPPGADLREGSGSRLGTEGSSDRRLRHTPGVVPEVLRYRAFRDVWLASLASNAGSWLQIVASGWLILQLTDSPAAVGALALVTRAPAIVLSTVGGPARRPLRPALGRHLDLPAAGRRRGRAGADHLASAAPSVWAIYVLTFLVGVGFALGLPRCWR